MNTNKKPRRWCQRQRGLTLYPGHRPEYRLSNSILSPIGRNSKGRFDDSPRLPTRTSKAVRP